MAPTMGIRSARPRLTLRFHTTSIDATSTFPEPHDRDHDPVVRLGTAPDRRSGRFLNPARTLHARAAPARPADPARPPATNCPTCTAHCRHRSGRTRSLINQLLGPGHTRLPASGLRHARDRHQPDAHSSRRHAASLPGGGLASNPQWRIFTNPRATRDSPSAQELRPCRASSTWSSLRPRSPVPERHPLAFPASPAANCRSPPGA